MTDVNSQSLQSKLDKTKKEYEEKLITLLKRTPRVHIVWNLNSIINEEDNIKWTKTDF